MSWAFITRAATEPGWVASLSSVAALTNGQPAYVRLVLACSSQPTTDRIWSRGERSALADSLTKQVKAGLSGHVSALYPQLAGETSRVS